jgi:DNA modification methylase
MLDFDFPAPTDTSPKTRRWVTHEDRVDASVSALEKKYADRIRVDPKLTRKAVSFQANKNIPVLRWYKYKEGFSAELVSRYLSELDFPRARILDPFAGAGTTLAQCAHEGFACEGIELLPIGQLITEARLQLGRKNIPSISRQLKRWAIDAPWKTTANVKPIPTLRITAHAYPPETERYIGGYLAALEAERGPAKSLLSLALMAVLESVSFTRKDGQYLRWDYRSRRDTLKSRFDKGEILEFDAAIKAKLRQMADDLDYCPIALRSEAQFSSLHRGSCLDVLPTLPTGSFGGIITSPPYCNRYDYTRTYALEHALLGTGEDETKALRQAMLTCTVENRQKQLTKIHQPWQSAIDACMDIQAFVDIVGALKEQAVDGRLNNPNIGRMVQGYFLEMSCVIFEFSRLLARGGKVVMVNDNVRYGGIDIPVDCLLSEIATQFGLQTIEISTLARGKGNSSQQMGAHGRRELRKSVYIWEKR